MHALLVGKLPETLRQVHQAAAANIGCHLAFVDTFAECQHLLDSGSDCRLVGVLEHDEILAALNWIRSRPSLCSLPVVALRYVMEDDDTRLLNELGVDDVVPVWDTAGLVRRLAKLADYDPSAVPPAGRGKCVLSTGSDCRAMVLSRTLRQSGFEVVRVRDCGQIEAHQENAALVVVETSEAGAASLPWATSFYQPTIVLTPPELRPHFRSALRTHHRLSSGLMGAPPDHLLFLINELFQPAAYDARRSRRLLFQTVCTFRTDDSLVPSYAVTLNLSREGLYVRTLDAPRRGSLVHLTLESPMTECVTQLCAEVRWVTSAHRPGWGTPPGFGVSFSERNCIPEQLNLYFRGYERLLTDYAINLARVA